MTELVWFLLPQGSILVGHGSGLLSTGWNVVHSGDFHPAFFFYHFFLFPPRSKRSFRAASDPENEVHFLFCLWQCLVDMTFDAEDYGPRIGHELFHGHPSVSSSSRDDLLRRWALGNYRHLQLLKYN